MNLFLPELLRVLSGEVAKGFHDRGDIFRCLRTESIELRCFVDTSAKAPQEEDEDDSRSNEDYFRHVFVIRNPRKVVDDHAHEEQKERNDTHFPQTLMKLPCVQDLFVDFADFVFSVYVVSRRALEEILHHAKFDSVLHNKVPILLYATYEASGP